MAGIASPVTEAYFDKRNQGPDHLPWPGSVSIPVYGLCTAVDCFGGEVMSRSHAIWVVLEYDPRQGGDYVAAAFTVKRELAVWYNEHPHPEYLSLWRCGNPVYNSGGRLGHVITGTEPVEESWDEVKKIIERERG